MASFRRGKKAAEAAKSSGGTFTPTFTWKNDGDEHFLQFLTPADEILTILYHNFIIVGENEDGRKIYRDFISPTDPAIGGTEQDDPLITRFDVKPKTCNAALAVALDPVTRGGKIVDFEVQHRVYTDKEGKEKSVPNVALVIQSVFTDLFPYLFKYADVQGPIEEEVFQITQTGTKKDKKLQVFRVGDAIDLDFDPVSVFDYEEHLLSLASPDRFAQYIDPLPDDAVVATQFGGDKNKNKASKRTTQKTTRSRVTTSRDSEDSEKTPTQSARFSRLKQRVES